MSNDEAPKLPIDPAGIVDAALALWAQYVGERVDAHLSCTTELDEMGTRLFRATAVRGVHDISPRDAFNIVWAALRARVQRERQQAFLDGFAMGCAFLAGAAKAKQDHDAGAFGGKAGA